MRAWLGEKAAGFWLNALFWHARHRPAVADKVKAFFLAGAWRCSPVLRRHTLLNARRLLGEASTPAQREALARRVIGNFFDFICDVGRSAAMTRAELLARIERIEGTDRYHDARADSCGVILVTAHMGSFEVATAALLDRERRVHVLFRRDAMDLFDRTRTAMRRRLGVIEAPVDEGLSVWVRLREALARDEAVLIQGDRVMPGQKGKPVPFLGGHVLLPTGPVKLAMASAAPILPVFCVRQPDSRLRLFIEHPIRVAPTDAPDDALLRLATVIERYVRSYPDQWLMTQPAWCEDVNAKPCVT